MKKCYITQSCTKFTPILKIFYKNLSDLGFFDRLIVYTDDTSFNPNDDFVEVIHGKDSSYSSNINKAVDACPEEFFFCGCEDYIFTNNKINKKILEDIFAYFLSNKEIGILRLNRASCINDKSSYINKSLGIYQVPKKYPYCVNLQPCLWRKNFFKNVYADKLNAWHFETKMSSRASKVNMLCACTSENLMPLINGNKKGNAYRDSFVDLSDKNNSGIDFSSSLVYVKRNGIKKTVSYKEYIENKRYNEIR